MKVSVRHILEAVFGAVLLFCIVCSFIAGSASRTSLKCSRLEVVVADSIRNGFVSKADIRQYLEKEYGQYIGIPIDSLDLTKIEKIIDGRSAVMKSQAYVTTDGVLHVEVTQRRPVVRFQKSGGGFYADAEGYIFPLQTTYASHVQVIDGNIPLAAAAGSAGKNKRYYK